MPIKCKSSQFFREEFNYSLAAGVNTLWMMKSFRDEVLCLHRISVKNLALADTSLCHFLVKHNGRTLYIFTNAVIVANSAETFEHDLYLKDREEFGIEITPNAVGDAIQVTIEGFRFRDSEYDMST